MDTKIAEEFLDELFSSLEVLETRSAAVLQFLKEQGEVTDEELAPYMEEASKASNVRWRAARLRFMSLFSSAVKSREQPSEKKAAQPNAKKESSGPQMEQTEAEPSQKASPPEESAETAKNLKQENDQAPDQDRNTPAKEAKGVPDHSSAGTVGAGTSKPAPQEANKKDAA